MLVQDPVLLNQWHPVMMSEDLKDDPQSAEVLGEKVVIFRTTKGVHAFKDLCIHRGVPLSLGTVVNDEIICPYHGWTYDACGTCTRIPALPKNQAIPSKARATAYYCTEAFGLVWVSLLKPIQEIPRIGDEQLNDPAFARVLMGPYDVEAAGPRVIENFLDVSHLMFVHEGLLGDAQYAEINDYRVRDEDGTLVTDEIDVYQPDPDGRGQPVVSKYTYKVYSPLTVSLMKTNDGSDDFFKLFLIVLPVNEQKSIAFMIMERNYALEEDAQVFIDFQNTLLEQDKVIVENQKPELLPLDLQAELHLVCDRLSIAYRKMLREKGVTFGTA